MAGIVTVIILITLISIAWDLAFYDSRMQKWETAHPGMTYVRNYRKLTGT